MGTEQLREWSRELAAAENSAWQPGCVAQAFASAGASVMQFTMQAWVNLDHGRSPLLRWEVPQSMEEIDAALAAFGHTGSAEDMTPDEAVACVRRMQDAIADGFGMALAMEPRKDGETSPGDGFGTWLPVMARLIADLHMSRHAALGCPVGQAFALLAAWRHNQGWVVRGESYAARDARVAANDEFSILSDELSDIAPEAPRV